MLLALVSFIAWSYYTKNGNTINSSPASFKSDNSVTFSEEKNNFRCDGRQHCSQMGSYEEAKFFIENCPDTKMDGDDDGIPCERQFGY